MVAYFTRVKHVIWTSPYDAVEVGGTTLPQMVLETARRAGDRPALVEGESGAAVSYDALAGRIEAQPAVPGGASAKATCLRCGHPTSPAGRRSPSAR